MTATAIATGDLNTVEAVISNSSNSRINAVVTGNQNNVRMGLFDSQDSSAEAVINGNRNTLRTSSGNIPGAGGINNQTSILIEKGDNNTVDVTSVGKNDVVSILLQDTDANTINAKIARGFINRSWIPADNSSINIGVFGGERNTINTEIRNSGQSITANLYNQSNQIVNIVK